MAEMKKTEMLTAMRTEAMSRLNLEGATQIDSNEWVVPVEGGYVSFKVTAKNPIGTMKVPAFDLDAAVEKYEAKVRESEEKAAAKAAAKAERLAKKAAKSAKSAE